MIRVFLAKSYRTAADCWPSLLEGQYEANALVRDQMQQKLTLERFQREVTTIMSNPTTNFQLLIIICGLSFHFRTLEWTSVERP